ncbi:hypothetical protein M2120_000449 [Aurantimicrobium minutum]|nr:hypothetical protein [Aurantimicrobium minutum]
MQLGTRWRAHSPAPSSLSQDVVSHILEVEKDLQGLTQDTTTWFWTLTYLENRPVVQLDDGTTIRVSPDGEITISQEG